MCDKTHDHEHAGHHHGPGLEKKARPEDFRVVITGKGGVGKTSIAALLARLLARQSWRVLALDADPQMNLPYALGLPAEQARALIPLSENADYVEEKTGARPGEGWGLFFRLNPDVDDVVERFGVLAPDAVRLLVMGNTVQPAAGCLCPENALLAAVVNAIALRPEEAILMDTQAGFEHFGRALARGFLHAVVVTNPTFNGVQAALHAARLARDLEIGAIHLVVNSVRDQAGFDLTMSRLEQDGHFPFASIHQVPYDERLRISEPSVEPVLADPSAPLMRSLAGVMATLTGGDSPLPETDHAFDPAIRQIAEEWGDRLPCVSLS
jgi:CO dehydrogenase maturation factor